MDYWKVIKESAKITLSQEESMKRLNEARVNLKHHGIIPSRLDIDSYRATTTAFFNDNCPIIFQLNFNDVSLIDIIKFVLPRELLKKARSDFEKGSIDESLQNLALSFEYLISDYEYSKRDKFHQSLFTFGESMTYLKSSHLRIKYENGKLKDFVDKVAESIEEIQKAIKILSLGIDYKKYVKYKSIVPVVVYTIDGSPHFNIDGNKKTGFSKEDLDFCINFMVESALKLQEFDFELSKQ